MQESSSRAPPSGPSAQPRGAVFLTGSILRHVLVMTSTGAIGLVAIFVAELIDVLFLSMLGDVEVVAAIGYAGPLVFLTVACAIGVSIATVALVAPALGAGDRVKARRISGSVHVITLVVSTLLSLALLPFLPWLLGLMGARGRTAQLAYDYLLIVVPSLPPLALAMTSSAVLRSLGDARRAMHVTLGAAVVVVVLDPILIFWMDLGLQGAAIATVRVARGDHGDRLRCRGARAWHDRAADARKHAARRRAGAGHRASSDRDQCGDARRQCDRDGGVRAVRRLGGGWLGSHRAHPAGGVRLRVRDVGIGRADHRAEPRRGTARSHARRRSRPRCRSSPPIRSLHG